GGRPDKQRHASHPQFLDRSGGLLHHRLGGSSETRACRPVVGRRGRFKVGVRGGTAAVQNGEKKRRQSSDAENNVNAFPTAQCLCLRKCMACGQGTDLTFASLRVGKA
ncbi:unnamed protein product, partial [Laminaria digitata]